MADERRPFNNRPESTIVQNFAADLDSMFGLDPQVERLSQTVQEKKATVSSSEQQLQELEARLRETEQRLARVSRHSSPSRNTAHGASPRTHADNHPTSEGAAKPSPLAQKPTYPADRPPTQGRPQGRREDTQQLMAGMPGAMPPDPPTAYNSSSEYIMVDRHAGQPAHRGYG